MSQTTYISEHDRKRNELYDRYEKIFESCHKEVFTQEVMALPKGDRKKYIVANLASLISKVSADFLFSEPVIVKTEDEKALARIEDIFDNSGLQDLLWEMALSTSYLGDGYLKARKEEDKTLIEYVDPRMVVVERNPDNYRQVLRYIIQWKRRINGKEYLRREVREFGVIKNELWMLNGDEMTAKVPLALAYEDTGITPPPDEQKTGVDGFLMVHIPNFKTAPNKPHGRSDYAELETVFAEINNRLTRDSHILDKHSNPKLAVPPGVLDKKGQVRRELFEMFEVGASANGAISKPEYITWNGNLTDSKTSFETLIKVILMVSETAPDVLGLNEGGVESGRALKFRLMRTLAKIKRKKRYFAEALYTIIKEATGLAGGVVEDFSLEFQDGLPTDYREEAEIREIEMRSGTVSLETAVRERNPDWSEEQITAELERIEKDHEIVPAPSTTPFLGDFSGNGGGGGSPAPANDPNAPAA